MRPSFSKFMPAARSSVPGLRLQRERPVLWRPDLRRVPSRLRRRWHVLPWYERREQDPGGHRSFERMLTSHRCSRAGGCDKLSRAEGTTKLATVRSAAPSTTCPGYAYQSSNGCSACADLGRGLSLTGTTSATCVSSAQSPCCNLPWFFLGFTGTTVQQYALMEFNIIAAVRSQPASGIVPSERRGSRATHSHLVALHAIYLLLLFGFPTAHRIRLRRPTV